MKKLLLFVFIQIVTFNFVFSQSINLVPNPSFEEFTNCPMNQGEIYFAKGWFNGCWYSPDYYNACANVSNVIFGTPISQANNFQIPKTGVAYAGITTYDYSLNFREYIAIKMSDSLIKNHKYCAKFYISFGATSHAVDLMGAYFSLDSLICNNGNLFNKTPQICNPHGNVLKDTLNWMKISGSFISTVGEQYMYIGDFYPDSQNTIFPFNLSFPNTISYYYIDDVSVCDCEDIKSKLGKDTTLCFGQKLLLKANIPQEADNVIYTWQDGSKDSSFLVTQSGTYWVSAYIEDYKITVCDSIKVNYTDCNTPQLWIPNSFSPNGDGLNDQFAYGNAENYEIKTYIYNRWGQLIFEGKNTDFWDGTYKNSLVPPGIYVYLIEATEKLSMKPATFKGRVTVVY